jgi:serine/threonine-protein kinase ULK2
VYRRRLGSYSPRLGNYITMDLKTEFVYKQHCYIIMNKSAQISKYVYSTKPIGKGSFSKVYKGFDIVTDEIIALKIIDKIQLKPELEQRLADEIELLTQLSHPNIVQLRDHTQDEDYFYLILEYLAGGDLSARIKKGRIPEQVVRVYMKQLADALQYLKARNIIHRDLKPQNILLTPDQKTIKLTDFNFARELFENDMAQTLCGSPLYMAPEIIENQEYTVKSDLWSVGLILYEMAYGNNPYFDAFNIVDLLQKINSRPIVYSDLVSEQCNDLIQGLLQPDPNDRIGWKEFFTNDWLQIDEPTFVENVQDNMWESISLSKIGSSRSKPMNISSRKFEVDIVDNYVPFGVTPPKYTRSDPVNVVHIGSPPGGGSRVFRPSSVPESRGVVDNIWSYMTSSATIIKGAVDYVKYTGAGDSK